MGKHLSDFEKQLMLDEIAFYSICRESDKEKILDHQPMSFQDFRRLSLLTDYLSLKNLHQFIWDLHAHKFTSEIDAVYEKCTARSEDLPKMLRETAEWLDDFWKNAPNPTVALLLREIFSNGLGS